MKTLLSISFFWIFMGCSIAQTTLTTVYLANGDAVEGTLVEYLQGTKLTIEQKNGKSTVIDTRDIEKIVQREQEITKKLKPKSKRKKYAFKERGVYNVTYFSSLHGQQDNTLQIGLGICNILGYQMTRLFGIGVGGGISNYSLENGETIIPLFIESRGYFKRIDRSPYYSVSLGYGIPSKNGDGNIAEATGGTLGSVNIGLRLGANESSNVLVDLGYQYQRAAYTRLVQFGEKEQTTVIFNRIVARVGLIF